jgi:hypothetical protein
VGGKWGDKKIIWGGGLGPTGAATAVIAEDNTPFFGKSCFCQFCMDSSMVGLFLILIFVPTFNVLKSSL